MPNWIVFLFTYFLTVGFFCSYSTATNEISLNVKKREIGWVNPDEMLSEEPDDWVNPFDMLDSENRKSQNNEKELISMKKLLHKYEAYMKRFVNLFLRCSGLKDYILQPGSVKQVQFEFLIQHSELDTLQKFAISGQGLPDVDAVLTKLLVSKQGTFFEHRSSRSEKSEGFQFVWVSSLRSYTSYISNSPELVIITIVVMMWMITFWTTYISGSYRMPIINLLILVFFAGFCFTWLRMYQEAEAARFQAEMMYDNAPPHCLAKDLSWYSRLYHALFSSGEDCTKYYKEKLVHPFVKVSPTVVLSETFSQMLMSPAKHVGQAYRDFIASAMGSVSWFLKPLIIVVAAVIPLIMFFGSFILLMGYSISLSPFTGLSIMPQWLGQRKYRSKEEDKYIEDVTEKQKKNKSDGVESIVSNVKEPLIFMNWSAFKKIKVSNKAQGMLKDSEIKNTSNDSLSDTSEDVEEVRKKRLKKKRDKDVAESTPNRAKVFSFESGDCSEITNTVKAKSKKDSQENIKNRTDVGEEERGDMEGESSTNNMSVMRYDEGERGNESSSTNKNNVDKSSSVQQWLNDNYTL